jgi:hypothetical protein
MLLVLVDSACNRNEYEEYFLGGKGSRCLRLSYHLHVPIVMKSRSPKLLEPSEPVQVSTEIVTLFLVIKIQNNLKKYKKNRNLIVIKYKHFLEAEGVLDNSRRVSVREA